MADKQGKFLDIWIVDIQKVYREVPYNVVVDWVQQGRLLEDDRARPTGTAGWIRVGDLTEVQPFLPHREPHRAEDRAEALEPVELDFTYKKARSTEDDDVDMIPLIDVSLVLLVFFMINAAGGVAAQIIPVPKTQYGVTTSQPKGIMIGIDLVEEDGQKVPVYSLSEDGKPPLSGDGNLRSLQELLTKLDEKLSTVSSPIEVTINAHENVQSGVVRKLAAELQKPARRQRINEKFIGVTEETQ